MNLTWVDAYVIGEQGVNLRKSAGKYRASLMIIPTGAALKICEQVEDVADGYRWVLAAYTTDNGKSWQYGFAAKLLLKIGIKPPAPDPIPEPPPPPKTKRSYVGIHYAFSGSIGNTIAIFEQMSRDGYPPPGVLICSDPGLCKTIKDIDKRIRVFYRWVGSDHDPFPMSGDNNAQAANGRLWYNELFRRHSQAVPFADVHVLHNEITFAGNTQDVEYAKRFNQFSMEMMERATQDGQKVTFGNFMPGVPEQKHIDAMADSFKYAEANGHWLNYHPYTSNKPQADGSYFSLDPDNGQPTNPYFGLRAVAWCKPYPRLNVVGGEASYYNGPRNRGEAKFRLLINEMQTMAIPLNTELREWLFMVWTARGDQDMNWKFDDITPLLPAWADESRGWSGK